MLFTCLKSLWLPLYLEQSKLFVCHVHSCLRTNALAPPCFRYLLPLLPTRWTWLAHSYYLILNPNVTSSKRSFLFYLKRHTPTLVILELVLFPFIAYLPHKSTNSVWTGTLIFLFNMVAPPPGTVCVATWEVLRWICWNTATQTLNVNLKYIYTHICTAIKIWANLSTAGNCIN